MKKQGKKMSDSKGVRAKQSKISLKFKANLNSDDDFGVGRRNKFKSP